MTQHEGSFLEALLLEGPNDSDVGLTKVKPETRPQAVPSQTLPCSSQQSLLAQTPRSHIWLNHSSTKWSPPNTVSTEHWIWSQNLGFIPAEHLPRWALHWACHLSGFSLAVKKQNKTKTEQKLYMQEKAWGVHSPCKHLHCSSKQIQTHLWSQAARDWILPCAGYIWASSLIFLCLSSSFVKQE